MRESTKTCRGVGEGADGVGWEGGTVGRRKERLKNEIRMHEVDFDDAFQIAGPNTADERRLAKEELDRIMAKKGGGGGGGEEGRGGAAD